MKEQQPQFFVNLEKSASYAPLEYYNLAARTVSGALVARGRVEVDTQDRFAQISDYTVHPDYAVKFGESIHQACQAAVHDLIANYAQQTNQGRSVEGGRVQ